jgi:nicotinamide mononucleotide (NMN) deamidase PncC
MLRGCIWACVLVVIVLVAVPLSGWAGGEGGLASAQSGGLIGGVAEKLKQADDEGDMRETSRRERTPEEREHVHEAVAQSQMEEVRAQEREVEQQS